MARIILSDILNDIRNAIGAHVYSVWKGVHYIREKAGTISNPRSAAQESIRARIAAAAKYWYAVLTDEQRALWEEYAKGMGSSTDSNSVQGGGTKNLIPTNRGVMSGFNAFILINGLNYSAGVAPTGLYIVDAPIGIDPPNAPTNLTGNCYTHSVGDPKKNYVELAWVDPLTPPDLGAGRIRIWGLSLDGGVHRQILGNEETGKQIFLVDNVRIAQGRTVPIADLPGHYHFQIDFIGTKGQKSPPSNVCQVELPVGVACPETPY